jgi:hypothetical protein
LADLSKKGRTFLQFVFALKQSYFWQKMVTSYWYTVLSFFFTILHCESLKTKKILLAFIRIFYAGPNFFGSGWICFYLAKKFCQELATLICIGSRLKLIMLN